MTDFSKVPDFMLERSIAALEQMKRQIDGDISSLRAQFQGRQWERRKKDQWKEILSQMIRDGIQDETQARLWLGEHGHSWKYAGEILSAMRKRVEDSRKAAREVEIFRRWWYCGEKKTHLARDFGLSRATVERICKKMSENENGLKEIFNWTRESPKKGRFLPPCPTVAPEPDKTPSKGRTEPLPPGSKKFLYGKPWWSGNKN